MTRLPRLTRLQRDFAHAFIAHPDPQVRLNATASYLAVNPHCTRPEVAKAAASRLLTKPHVRAAIQTLQIQADAETLTRLVDWKMAAIEAQPILLNLARGLMPDGQRMQSVADAAAGHVILGALKEILARGFPKAIYVKIDARQALAKLLGVPVERLPERWDEPEEDT